jgi:hypothetical protein
MAEVLASAGLGASPPDKPLHLIVDNYAAHKHEMVCSWLAKITRFTVHSHLTPLSG